MSLMLNDYENDDSLIIPTTAYELKDTPSPSILEGAYCIGSQGLMDLPESKIEPVERSYADGAVFPPKIYRRQNDFTIDILFTSREEDGGKVSPTYPLGILSYFLHSGVVSVILSTENMGAEYTAQCQKIEIIDEKLIGEKPRIVARLYFVGEGYFF